MDFESSTFLSLIPALAIEVYRRNNPHSRAAHKWTFMGSTGAVRKQTCVFCRGFTRTSSAKWPIPKGTDKALDQHCGPCSLAYLIGHVGPEFWAGALAHSVETWNLSFDEILALEQALRDPAETLRAWRAQVG